MVSAADVSPRQSVLKTATASQWAIVERLRATFPSGVVTLMNQRLRCRRASAAAEVRQPFVVVAVDVGPVTVRREFRA